MHAALQPSYANDDADTRSTILPLAIHNLLNGTVLIFSAAYRHPVANVGETHSAELFQNETRQHIVPRRCTNRHIPGFSIKFLLSETDRLFTNIQFSSAVASSPTAWRFSAL